MKPLIAWLGKALSGASGSPSTARVGYFAFVLGGAAWLTGGLIGHGMDEHWVMAFGIYASACTGGYVGGKVAGRPNGNTNVTRDSGTFEAKP